MRFPNKMPFPGMRAVSKKGEKMTNIYEVNQIFEGNYPAEAAVFCNKHNLRIVQIETLDQAKRFQIQEIPALSDDEKSVYLRKKETNCCVILILRRLMMRRSAPKKKCVCRISAVFKRYPRTAGVPEYNGSALCGLGEMILIRGEIIASDYFLI